MAKQEHVIRPAREDDIEEILRLKHSYMLCLFQGFLDASIIANMDEEFWRDQIEGFIHDPAIHVAVLELENHIGGYAVYTAEPEDPRYGLIEEYAADLSLESAHRDALIVHTMTDLADQGFTKVHQWVLRDNFRLRFLIERFGFKPDGGYREMDRGGHSLRMTRYLYRMPGHEHEI